jgi:diaminohydroxyphosphoribosylaminopyrimidine deaminase/5-amino-6-(5-phosphoribosylamino)uracil reductase
VVVASEDPNPQVSGKGIKLLRDAGIEVKSGICHADNRELNRFFFKNIVTGLPYITLKIAQTLDGKIARKLGEQSWITNEQAQKLVHQWRAEYDAVLVGAHTIRVDDPELTVRKVKGRNPKRIVVSNSMNLPEKSNIFTQAVHTKTYILSTSAHAQDLHLRQETPGIIYLHSDSQDRIDQNALRRLARENIASILVEGGQQIFSRFLSAGLADEINVFIAPKIFGSGMQSYAGPITDLSQDYALKKIQRLRDDLLISLRKN